MKIPRVRLGLLGRIALALGAVGLLPVLISSFGLVDINRTALYDQVQRAHVVAARTGAARVEAFLSTRESLARGAAASPALADPRSPEAQEVLLASLQSWSDLGALAVAVVNARGEEVVRAQLKGEEVRSRVAAALRPRPAKGERTELVPGQSPPVLRIAAPLPAGDGSLVLVCDAEALLEVVRPTELGEQADLLVAGRDGRVVLGAAASLAELPPELVRNALSGRVVGMGRFQSGGETILGAYAPVPGSDWVVISRQPTRIAEAVAGRMRRQTGLALGAAVLLIAALAAGAWASLVRPIRELVTAQRNLAGVGAGAANAPRSGDEIEDLRRTFDLLQRNLSDRRELDNVFLGRYQVLQVLGTGAMGAVFRGWDPRLQRPVALKTVRIGPAVDPGKRKDLIDSLLREAVTGARFSHANVVAVYDLEDTPEAAFIAMELVDGMSLELLLHRRESLTPDEVVPLAAGIARGLAAAHAQEIVHRDVKPANVLLGRDGSIKVTDFGIAGLLAAATESHDTIFGTPGYMPPETLRGEGQGKAGDLYALGVLMYTCLAGAMPFAEGDVGDVLRATLFGTIKPLSRQVPGIPGPLASLVEHLLERDPRIRPSSAAAVADELERMAAGRGLRWRLDPGQEGVEPRPASGTVSAQWVNTAGLQRL